MSRVFSKHESTTWRPALFLTPFQILFLRIYSRNTVMAELPGDGALLGQIQRKPARRDWRERCIHSHA